MPTIALQRWLYKKRVILQVSKSSIADVNAPANAALEALPLSPDDVAFRNPNVSTDLYFLPGDTVKLQKILENFQCTFPEGMFPKLEVSNLVLHDFGAGSIAQWIPFFNILAKREYRHRSREKDFTISKLRHGVTRKSSLSIIKRRGMKCSRAEMNAMEEAYVPKHTPVVTAGDTKSLQRRYLVVLRFASQHSRGLFIRILNNLNKGQTGVVLKYLLQEVVVRMVAACAIQCAVRSWRQRCKMKPALATAVFAQRAVRLIQRWWRWKILQLRLNVLVLVKRLVIQNGETPVLYCFAKKMRQRFEEASQGYKPIFREAKYFFDFNENSEIFVHKKMPENTPEPSEENTTEQQWDDCEEQRPFLPQWIGMFAHSSDFDSVNSSSEISPSRTGSPMRANVMRRNLDFPQESSGNASNIKTILQNGCEVQLSDTFAGAVWEACTSDGETQQWKIPKRNLLGGNQLNPVIKLTFSSALEARRRMALLLIKTYRPRTRDPVLLLNVDTAAQHVFAMHIQSIFRGFLTRRWWRLITTFLRMQLGTSFLSERAQHVSGNVAPAEALFGKLPDKLKGALKKLSVSEDSLRKAMQQQASLLAARAPTKRLSRYRGQPFHIPPTAVNPPGGISQ